MLSPLSAEWLAKTEYGLTNNYLRVGKSECIQDPKRPKVCSSNIEDRL